MSFSLCFLFCLTSSSLVAVRAKGLKILGGYVKEYDPNSRVYYGKAYKWGQFEADGNSIEKPLQNMYCWTSLRQNDGYCYQRLVVSTIDDPNEEHYQIIGSYQKIYDRGSIIVETRNKNGMTEEKPPYQKVHVASGDMWSLEKDGFRYGNLFFFINRTTQASITDDISFIVQKVGQPNVRKEETFWDYHESTSAKVLISEVRKWTTEWSSQSYARMYFWRAPTTLLNAEPLNDQVNVISHDRNVKKTLVLNNKGSGVTSSEFPILGTTQTITSTSESRFLRTWDFEFSISHTVSFSALAVGTETTISASFAYHNEREMTQTRSVETSVDMQWPNECRAGFRITHEVAEVVEEQEVPVELRFERAGVEWTEIDIVRVTLRKLVLTRDDCCLFNWADELCGSESLNMCVDFP